MRIEIVDLEPMLPKSKDIDLPPLIPRGLSLPVAGVDGSVDIAIIPYYLGLLAQICLKPEPSPVV